MMVSHWLDRKSNVWLVCKNSGSGLSETGRQVLQSFGKLSFSKDFKAWWYEIVKDIFFKQKNIAVHYFLFFTENEESDKIFLFLETIYSTHGELLQILW